MGFKVLEVLMSRAASFDFGMQLHLHLAPKISCCVEFVFGWGFISSYKF
jgi:hypothetical protein